MAQITGQAGVNLTQELANYLDASGGNLTSEQLQTIINQYLSGGDKLGATGGSISNGIYKRFGEFDQVSGKVQVVTTGLWSGDTGSLTSFFTSSTQEAAASANYYVNVYDTAAADNVQFAVAYGHKFGSGSVSLANNDDSKLASKATYAQYRSILLDQDEAKFKFISASGDTIESDDVFVINLARARYKEKMDAGNWSVILSGSSMGEAIYSGVSREGKNHFLLYNYINGGSDFQARRTENVSTSHYFVRATNREFNFSNNPTYVTGSDGSFAESTFERDPRSYITTVGLFSDSNELIAVAKTSQPIPKSFDKEVLIKVKLDF